MDALSLLLPFLAKLVNFFEDYKNEHSTHYVLLKVRIFVLSLSRRSRNALLLLLIQEVTVQV